MADNSYYVPDNLDFHPCDTPRGMEYYNLDVLTGIQQKRLNIHKIEAVRDNQTYLFKNPEIRAVIQIILRKLFLERPSHDIESFVGRYFKENWEKITEEVKKYVDSLPGKPEPITEKIVIKDEKHVTLDDARIDVSSIQLSLPSEEDFSAVLIQEILEEILDKLSDIPHPKKVTTSDSVEVIDEKKHAEAKSYEDDEEIFFDLGLDFDLDFTTYHEEDDKY